jgi:hypothetical protein
MEFTWDIVGVISSLAVLATSLGFYLPKFVKYILTPRINVYLFTYPSNKAIQHGVKQSEEERKYYKEMPVSPNSKIEVGISLAPKWKYEVKIIEVLGHDKSKISLAEIFAKDRFWLEKQYEDIHGNCKIFPNLVVRKGDITDPTWIDIRLEPPFKKGEERKLSVKISTNESRKLLVNEFLIKASTES